MTSTVVDDRAASRRAMVVATVLVLGAERVVVAIKAPIPVRIGAAVASATMIKPLARRLTRLGV